MVRLRLCLVLDPAGGRWSHSESGGTLRIHFIFYIDRHTQGEHSKNVFTDRQTFRQPRALFIYNCSGKRNHTFNRDREDGIRRVLSYERHLRGGES